MKPKTKYDRCISDVKFRIECRMKQWDAIVEELQFQLPVKSEGEIALPTNIHLLSTLQRAVSLYQELAVLSHAYDLLTKDPVRGWDRK